MEDLDVITAGISARDGCPILNRIKAFIVPEATAPTLEHIFRGRNGNPLDLTSPLIVSESAPPASDSLAPFATDTVLVRAQEFTGDGTFDACVKWMMEGRIENAGAGVVRVNLDRNLCQQSGLYRLSFGFVRDAELKTTNECLLSVEPTLFGGRGNGIESHRRGCITINEIRMQLWDSSGNDNPLLQDVEFSDDQLALAIAKPIQYFNEHTPPLPIIFNTTNFPFRSNWVDATIGYLLQFAAAYYRRNRLDGASGGIEVNDTNKEPEYLRASKMYLDKWEEFVVARKVAMNTAMCVGTLGSEYGGYDF